MLQFAHCVCGTIQFHMFNTVWQKFLDIVVVLHFPVSLVSTPYDMFHFPLQISIKRSFHSVRNLARYAQANLEIHTVSTTVVLCQSKTAWVNNFPSNSVLSKFMKIHSGIPKFFHKFKPSDSEF